jgi:hypothetical protein
MTRTTKQALTQLRIMTLRSFLDDKSFHSLKQSVPPGSHSKLRLPEAVQLNFFGSNAVISCDEAEARNLLIYAGHCPGVIASIHKASRSAGLCLETSEKAHSDRPSVAPGFYHWQKPHH